MANIIKGEVKFEDKIWKKYSISLKHFVSHLIKKVDERINLFDLENHLWLLEISSKENIGSRKRRRSSFDSSVNDEFHYEFKKIEKYLHSKEEGSVS